MKIIKNNIITDLKNLAKSRIVSTTNEIDSNIPEFSNVESFSVWFKKQKWDADTERNKSIQFLDLYK